MKRIRQILRIVFLLVFCAGCGPTYISKVLEKPYPAYDVIQKQDIKIYYLYTYYGEGFRSYGWWCDEFRCDLDGKILKKKSYWVDNDTAWKEFWESIKRK